jgi:hypothetical protein
MYNENILKLRELTQKICETTHKDENFLILKELKNIIEEGKGEISESKSSVTKIKCYEKMCLKITNILNNVKL